MKSMIIAMKIAQFSVSTIVRRCEKKVIGAKVWNLREFALTIPKVPWNQLLVFPQHLKSIILKIDFTKYLVNGNTNYGILLPPFMWKFRESKCFTLNWFDEKNLHGSEFLVFPHCAVEVTEILTWKYSVNSTYVLIDE